MKWLVLKKLAPWLRVRVSSKTPTSSSVGKDNNDSGDFQQDGPQLQVVARGTTDKLKGLSVRFLSKTPTSYSLGSDKDNNDSRDFQQDGPQLAQVVTRRTTDKLMLEIRRELLHMRLGSKSDDPDRENKNDWKLAAAVIDRILCIIFSILFLGGTIVFIVTFVVAYIPSS